MQAFIIRRLLLMIPTLFGISFLTWLIMMMAPGRPGGTGLMMEGDSEQIGDMTKELEKGKAQRRFRRQYGLDRPLFFNDWTDLDADEVLGLVETAAAPISKVGAKKKRKAREQLEDYGHYSIPPLIELINRSELTDDQRFELLRWLLRNSNRPSIETGKRLDKKTIEKNRAIQKENRALAKLRWQYGALREEQDAVVAQWTKWYEEHIDRWELSAAGTVKVALLDTGFGTYWSRLAHGDFGISHIHKMPVTELVFDRMKYSIALNVTAMLIAYLLAVPIGIWAAVKRGTRSERGVGIVLFALYSLPNFFVGALLVKYLASGEPFKWFPISGFDGEDAASMNTSDHFKDVLWHITLPLFCMTYGALAGLSRYSRAGMLDQIQSDYVRTARAKGVTEFKVISRHVVRNGILPIITLLGTSLPVIIGGSVAIEYIFSINGMGLLMINSIMAKDFNVIMGVQLMVGVLTMIGILISDITYAVLDPRISLR